MGDIRHFRERPQRGPELTMHLTNLQLVLILFVCSNVAAYLLGRWHARGGGK